jgi:hypothetical protein
MMLLLSGFYCTEISDGSLWRSLCDSVADGRFLWPYGAPCPSWKCVLLSIALFVDDNTAALPVLKIDDIEF